MKKYDYIQTLIDINSDKCILDEIFFSIRFDSEKKRSEGFRIHQIIINPEDKQALIIWEKEYESE